ncbi:uncharacterized protein E0L32_009286 [Thyridium curvatum]|uniref:BHLH domain-containing protein n=1 Tax=Thyridium curvatum TaxID=1093900 RepID=A0A507AP65_9PEZI|nr:uncharacterized protein E0L32_009286 [Thyridium curvatum]TPX09543.1 hypothetical protein E0L32_009286 [Thyridium curvatum]
MLALSPPRMASGQQQQPADSSMPFGYSFDQSQELLFQDAPDPAPGAPILSDNDTKFLSSFFEGMTADPIGGTSFGEGLNFSDEWFQTLPPQFMGTATSFGQQSQVLGSPGMHTLPPDAFGGLLGAPVPLVPPQQHIPGPSLHPLQQHHSEDVLQAAAALHDGSMARPNGGSRHQMATNGTMASALGPPVGHLRHQNLDDFRNHDANTSHPHLGSEHDHTFADMMFGGGSVRPGAPRRPRQNVEVQWGSDASFNNGQSFLPPSQKETAEALSEEQMKCMGCLEVSRSAATTRPSSPAPDGDSTAPFTKLKTRTAANEPKTEHDADTPPKKRRKSKAKEEPEEDENDEPSSGPVKGVRKRKPKVDGAAVPTSTPDGSGKRRKSSANGLAKQPRENLTEEQKRENHIKSEQKRRTLIRDGFKDMCDIVPGLKEGGFSKSTMLTMAGDWLDELLAGNKSLRAQLEGR